MPSRDQPGGPGAAAVPSADGSRTVAVQLPARRAKNQRDHTRLCFHTTAMSSFFPASRLSVNHSERFLLSVALSLATAYSHSQCRPTGEHQEEEDGGGSSALLIRSSPCSRLRGVAHARLSEWENGDSIKVDMQT